MNKPINEAPIESLNKRRAGVLTPLFSIYSNDSIGIGDIHDILKLVDWCVITGQSIIQLLPINISGPNNSPYSCESAFAIDPIYISLKLLTKGTTNNFATEIENLRKTFKDKKLDYNEIRNNKLEILKKVYSTQQISSKLFDSYKQSNKYWLDDFAIYQILKMLHKQKPWYEWELAYIKRGSLEISKVVEKYKSEIEFYKWIQWQLYEQFVTVKRYANEHNVLIMGDIPMLVARDSADVWSHQDYFQLDYDTGSPPDLYFPKGQRWNMPPYNWEKLSQDNYEFFKNKLQFTEHFYDLVRIDHFAGLFRLWAVNRTDPETYHGIKGQFIPNDSSMWHKNGEDLFKRLLMSTKMQICVEDLGLLPCFIYKLLEYYNTPGMDVQRWERNWETNKKFKNPKKYRINSVSLISNHDMAPLKMWWEKECGIVSHEMIENICDLLQLDYQKFLTLFVKTSKGYTWSTDIRSKEDIATTLNLSSERLWMVNELFNITYNEREYFWEFLGFDGKPKDVADKSFIYAALKISLNAKSVFSIQLIQDWFSLGDYFKQTPNIKINTPGEVLNNNWSFVMPVSLEEMLEAPLNKTIKELISNSNR